MVIGQRERDAESVVSYLGDVAARISHGLASVARPTAVGAGGAKTGPSVHALRVEFVTLS